MALYLFLKYDRRILLFCRKYNHNNIIAAIYLLHIYTYYDRMLYTSIII